MQVAPEIFWTAFTACILGALFLGKVHSDVINLKERFDRLEETILKRVQ